MLHCESEIDCLSSLYALIDSRLSSSSRSTEVLLLALILSLLVFVVFVYGFVKIYDNVTYLKIRYRNISTPFHIRASDAEAPPDL